MAGDVEVRTQILQARLGQLVPLVDDTDRLKGRSKSLSRIQDRDVWPGIPSAAASAWNRRAALRDAADHQRFRLLAERPDTMSTPAGGRGL